MRRRGSAHGGFGSARRHRGGASGVLRGVRRRTDRPVGRSWLRFYSKFVRNVRVGCIEFFATARRRTDSPVPVRRRGVRSLDAHRACLRREDAPRRAEQRARELHGPVESAGPGGNAGASEPSSGQTGVRRVIGGRRPISGRKPGDRRVRVERPHTAYFRYTGPNQLAAKPSASAPRTPLGRTLLRLKGWLIGRPLANEEEAGERLSKRLALPIFSSDAISSSAYATEEILRVLVIGGAAAFLLSVEVAAAIAVLLAVVAVSHRQVCRASPNGGGAYAVARQELTPLLGLVAAAALLIDYVMTVAVSTSSAVEQLISIAPGINDYKVYIAVAVITLITIANLRGLRESGNIFAVPTYVFVVLALGIVGLGVANIVTGHVSPLPPQPNAEPFDSQPLM